MPGLVIFGRLYFQLLAGLLLGYRIVIRFIRAPDVLGEQQLKRRFILAFKLLKRRLNVIRNVPGNKYGSPEVLFPSIRAESYAQHTFTRLEIVARPFHFQHIAAVEPAS